MRGVWEIRVERGLGLDKVGDISIDGGDFLGMDGGPCGVRLIWVKGLLLHLGAKICDIYCGSFNSGMGMM